MYTFFLSCYVQHRAKGSEDPYKEIDGIATTRYSVGGLSPYSHYDFRVAAINTIGQGPSSEVVEARTAEQAPSSPPRQVRLMPRKSKPKLLLDVSLDSSKRSYCVWTFIFPFYKAMV